MFVWSYWSYCRRIIRRVSGLFYIGGTFCFGHRRGGEMFVGVGDLGFRFNIVIFVVGWVYFGIASKYFNNIRYSDSNDYIIYNKIL
jgi:hypothetical protein